MCMNTLDKTPSYGTKYWDQSFLYQGLYNKYNIWAIKYHNYILIISYVILQYLGTIVCILLLCILIYHIQAMMVVKVTSNEVSTVSGDLHLMVDHARTVLKKFIDFYSTQKESLNSVSESKSNI